MNAPSPSISPLVRIAGVLREQLPALVGSDQYRITSVRRSHEGWTADVELFARDPRLSISTAAGSKDILRRVQLKVDVDTDYAISGFTEVDRES